MIAPYPKGNLIFHYLTTGALLLAAMFAAVTAAGANGAVAGGVVIAVVLFAARGLNTKARWRRVMTGTVGGLALLAIIWGPPISGMSLRGRVSWCNDNLQSIGMALYNYHQEWGHFPPAYLVDEAGQPVHSWRLLLLPFVESARFSFDHDWVFARYDFDFGWNAAQNSELMKVTSHDGRVLSAVRLYQCPTRSRVNSRSKLTAHYFVVIGRNTAWPGHESRSLEHIAIPEQTILIVECFHRAVPWLEPRDIALDEVAAEPRTSVSIPNWWLGMTRGSRLGFGMEGNEAIRQYHGYLGRHALFADGTVRLLPNDLSAADFRALADIRDVPKPVLPPPPCDREAVPEMIRRLPFPPVVIRWAGFVLFLAALAATASSVKPAPVPSAQETSSKVARQAPP